MNWLFALEVAGFGGLLGGAGCWMIHAALFPTRPQQAPRSDEPQ